MKKKKREKRKKREKNLPKRLLPASRNSRAISMLRSLPSFSPLSLLKRDLTKKANAPMNNGTRTLSPATSFVASMLSTHCLSSCCVAQLFGNRCQIYIYIYTCLCIYFSLSSISDLYISSQKILMKNSSPAEENFIVILKKKDSMINHYSYFCYFHKKKKIIRFKNRWKKSSIDRSIDHGMEEAECSAIKFIRSARRRSSNGRERMDGCGARIVNSNIKIEPVPSTETYSSQNLVAKRRRRVDPPIDNASLR